MEFEYLPICDSREILRSFIRKNISGASKSYRYSMGHGDFYGSCSHPRCMWESFDAYTVISPGVALSLLNQMDDVYVTWDGNSAKISRKLQKSRLIKSNGTCIASAIKSQGFSFAPSDFYCISNDISYCVIFTHYNLRGIGDICLTTKPNLENTGIPAGFMPLFRCYRRSDPNLTPPEA